MENYELNIYEPLQYNPVNGRFLSNHIPFNKGIPMKDWMDGRKIKRVVKCLEIGRKLGNKHLPEFNRKRIVGIKDGKLIAFNCAANAETALTAKGIKVSQRNINKVCGGKNKYRRRAGGYFWFFAENVEKYKDLLQ
jgi:hypothetical protein